MEELNNRREDIREHAIIDLMNYKGFHRAPTECIVDYVLQSLDLEGCVLRVEKKLPSVFNSNEDVMSALKYREKLVDYVAIEPLIEEEKRERNNTKATAV